METPKGDAARLEQVHGLVDLLVGASTSTRIGSLFAALGRDNRDEVLHAGDFLDEVLVDERGIGEAEEGGVRMGVTELDEVCLAHERLATRVDKDVRTKLVALVDDGVDVFVAQVEFVAVLGCPAPPCNAGCRRSLGQARRPKARCTGTSRVTSPVYPRR